MTNTGNPYVDNLVYYTKIFGLGTVLKDTNEAEKYETLATIRASDIYIHCIEHTAIFEYFDNFPPDVIRAAIPFVAIEAKTKESYIGGMDNYIPYIGVDGYVEGLKEIISGISSDSAEFYNVDVSYGEKTYYYLYGYYVNSNKQLWMNAACTTKVSTAIDNICNAAGKTINPLEVTKDGSYYYIENNGNKYYVAPADISSGLHWYIHLDVINYPYDDQIYYRVSTNKQLYSDPECTTPVDHSVSGVYNASGLTTAVLILTKHDDNTYYYMKDDVKYYVSLSDVEVWNNKNNGMIMIANIVSKLDIQIDTAIIPNSGDWMVINLQDNDTNYSTNKYLLQADLKSGKLDNPANYERNMTNLIRAMEAYYVENYEEWNNYYRMLTGLPPLPEDVTNTYYNPDVDDVLENFSLYFPPGLTFNTTDLETPIYKLSESNIELLNNYGLLETFYASDPDLKEDRRYMRYIAKEISLYKARKADKFSPLYVPSVVTIIDDIYKIRDTFIDRLNNKRLYVIKTIYSEAYNYDSKYYDQVIAMMIILLAMNDTINRASEFIAVKDIFDWRIVKAILEGYGVKYFDGMPIKYQIALCDNIQTILKEKSTTKCMQDLLNIFGMTNIEIFRYFLVKRRKTDKDGNYIISLDGEGKHILEDEYDLAFLRVPIDDTIDKYIREPTNYVSYDEITADDPFWSRDYPYTDTMTSAENLKKNILEQNFNYVFSKFISIDSYQQVQESSNMQSYIFTILYDKLRLEEYLTIKIPYIDSSSLFRLSDVFTFMTVLTYLYYDTVDEIIENASDILYLDGFNFSYNMKYITSIIEDTIGTYKGYTYTNANKANYARVVYDEAFEDAEEFIIPGQITTIPALIKVYDTNMNVRDKLLYRIMNANNLEEYRCYTEMYDALMKVKATTEFFKEPVVADESITSITSTIDVPAIIRIISNYQNKLTIYKNNNILIENNDYTIDISTNKITFTEPLAVGDALIFYSYKGLYVDPETGIPTYTEYLKNRDMVLYNKIKQIEEDYPVNYVDGVPNESDLESRRNYIDSLTDQIIDTLSTYNLNITEFFPLFNGFSSSLKDMLQSYIRQTIDFFKSYKAQIYTFKQNYVVNNKLQSYIRPIDGMTYDIGHAFSDMYRFADDYLLYIHTIKYDDGRINPADYKDAILDNIHDSIFFSYTESN